MRRLLVFALVAGLPHGAQAQQPAVDAVTAMTQCRAVPDPAARLACFDETAAAVERAREEKELIVLDKSEVRTTRRSLFGFTLPRIKFLEGDGKEEPESEIETTIDTVRSLGYGKWVVKTAEGASWQTTEPMSDTPRSGAKITIKRGALGSYFLKVSGYKAVRAMRTG
jgi:hypothetical protein